jgi:hypothetical protein
MSNATTPTTTKENNFGRTFKIGDTFIIRKNFGKTEQVVKIKSISPSMKFFKVDGFPYLTFSIETLRSKGSTITSGYYLHPEF